MSHDLTLAQNHAFHLARTLMVPVILFRADGGYGVLAAEDLYASGEGRGIGDCGREGQAASCAAMTVFQFHGSSSSICFAG